MEPTDLRLAAESLSLFAACLDDQQQRQQNNPYIQLQEQDQMLLTLVCHELLPILMKVGSLMLGSLMSQYPTVMLTAIPRLLNNLSMDPRSIIKTETHVDMVILCAVCLCVLCYGCVRDICT